MKATTNAFIMGSFFMVISGAATAHGGAWNGAYYEIAPPVYSNSPNYPPAAHYYYPSLDTRYAQPPIVYYRPPARPPYEHWDGSWRRENERRWSRYDERRWRGDHHDNRRHRHWEQDDD
ncbi:MAG: hypothetical protein JWN13_6051 [Betaproteobacteria bacterium]|jgi:hypothetical protein|nr:hypothetical protein [Betaproteobacteria bacterium]